MREYENQNISESVIQAMIDYQIAQQLRKMAEKQKNLEEFLNAFDDFMNNI